MGDVGGDNESEAGTDDDSTQQRQGLDDLSDVIVINELLSYCVFHYNNSSVDAIKRVVIDFYHPTEISEAKRILWNSSSQEIIGPRPLRRNPNANGKNLDDIFTALQVLDEQSETIPTFAAVKLDGVPRYAPEEIDMTSMILRINDLERKCARLDKQVANNSDTIQTVMDAQMQSNSYASAMKRGPDNAQLQPRNSSTTVATPARTSNQNVSFGTRVGDPRPPRVQGPAATPSIGTTSVAAPDSNSISAAAAAAVASNPTSSGGDAGAENDHGDGFQRPANQIRRERKRARKNNNIIFGTKEPTTLKAGPRLKEIFVFNLESDTDDNAIKTHLESKGLEKRSHADAVRKSYRLVINYTDNDIVMNSECWPEGVGIRPYYRPRDKSKTSVNTTQQHHGS